MPIAPFSLSFEGGWFNHYYTKVDCGDGFVLFAPRPLRTCPTPTPLRCFPSGCLTCFFVTKRTLGAGGAAATLQGAQCPMPGSVSSVLRACAVLSPTNPCAPCFRGQSEAEYAAKNARGSPVRSRAKGRRHTNIPRGINDVLNLHILQVGVYTRVVSLTALYDPSSRVYWWVDGAVGALVFVYIRTSANEWVSEVMPCRCWLACASVGH
jgi:hypothetical protein